MMYRTVLIYAYDSMAQESLLPTSMRTLGEALEAQGRGGKEL